PRGGARMSRPPQRRCRKVKIILSPNEAGDPVRILKAIEHALRPTDLEVNFCGEPEKPAEPLPPERPLPNEQLETKVREAVRDRLEDRKRDIQRQNEAQGRPGNARVPAPPEDVIEERERVAAWTRWMFKAGWGITCFLAKEAVKEIAKKILF
ncbi:MAG: hypothetical protein KJ749_10815, partial [Planctomycetes bacterium]|nr:hypothetical protein [Planctomycetota bacterium]